MIGDWGHGAESLFLLGDGGLRVWGWCGASFGAVGFNEASWLAAVRCGLGGSP